MFDVKKLINFGLFAVGSFACILLANHWALLIVACVLLFHLRTALPGEWQFIAQASVLGWLFDSILFRSNILGQQMLFPPVWLSCIWPILATAVVHSLSFSIKHLSYAALFGAIYGTACYLFVSFWQNIPRIEPSWRFCLIVAAGWAVIYLLLAFIARSRISSLSVN